MAMRLRTILLTVLCVFSCIAFAQEISIIPQPAQMTVGKGAFLLQGKVVICYPADK